MSTAATTQWRNTDLQHHVHPFTDHQGLAQEGGTRVIVKADGVWLEDSDGVKILDGMSGLWCVNIGYGRKELAYAASAQMLELPYYNTFFKTSTPPPIELSEKLVELTPEGLNRTFFASSGSEANETIVRMVRRYWNLMGRPNKKTFISRVNAYHGSTSAAASLGGMKPMHEMDDLPLPGFVHVMQPYWYQEGGDLSLDEFGRKAAQAVEDKILELGADNIAAFFGEPIQGAGGVIVPPDNYWPEVQRICKKHDVLLIADEVICGFGRTGHWFGSDCFNIKPDLMAMAKGLTSGYLPLSAVMIGDRVAEVLYERGEELAHGYTYSGHPTCCTVALANIAIMEREGLIDRVHEETGPYFQARLRELSDHPLVGNIRGIGMLAGLAVVIDKTTRKALDKPGALAIHCHKYCMQNNAVIRASGDSMVLAPPLVISKDEIDILIKQLKKSLDQTAQDFDLV